MRYIGDVHGKYRQYKRIIRESPASVQVGDMGVGFRKFAGGSIRPMANPPHYLMAAGEHRFIRGNHDNPAACARHSQWIPDGTVYDDVMYVGGALSVDREHRTLGLDWWEDEELPTRYLHTVMDIYLEVNPRVMVTHDCPEDVAERLAALSGRRKLDMPSRTRQAFQSMFECYQPDVWVFGHWHYSFDNVIEGTRFVCLDELEYKDID